MSMLNNVLYKVMIIFMSLCSLFCSVPQPATDDPIKVLNQDQIRLSAVLWGDPQLADYMYKRFEICKNSCLDIANSDENLDALVIAGDITENGKATEYRAFLEDLSVVDTVENYVLAVGNHDVRLRNYNQVKNLFCNFYKDTNKLAGNNDEIDELSYVKIINGYTFIVLGTTRTEFEESYFNEERLQWFENELNKASRSGLPIFVVCHQPLKLTHNLPHTWGSPIPTAGTVGAQSDRLRDIMNNYDNLFFITGHLHTGFNKSYTYEKIDNFHGINLPAIGPNNADGYKASGIGYVMEVYDQSVIFRARNFAAGKYLPEYDINVDLH